MFMFVKNPHFRQYATVVTVNLCMVSSGLNMAWSSPVLVKLTNANQTVLDAPLTEEQGSWLVSFGTISNLFGERLLTLTMEQSDPEPGPDAIEEPQYDAEANFLAAFLANRIGRKYCLLVAAVPRIIGQILVTFVTKFWLLLVGKLCGALGDGLLMVIIPMYASEIASNEIRGSVGMAFQIACSTGIVTMFCMGPYLEYVPLNAIVLAAIILTTLPVVFLPDSPCYLLSKDKKEEAMKVLTFLRGSTAEAENEIIEHKLSMNSEKTSIIEVLKSKRVIKTIALVIIFGAGTQLTGYNAVSSYLQTIFTSTNTNVPPEICSVIVGCIQFVSCFFTLAIIDKFGRKPILVTSLVAMALGYVGVGIFFHIQSSKQYSIDGFLNYLPLISIILIVFSHGAGLGSLMWPLMCELFDSQARALGLSVGISSAIIFLFLIQKFFATLVSTIGPATTYWIFCFNTLLLCLFILFCIPETKGKSFVEIQAAMKGK